METKKLTFSYQEAMSMYCKLNRFNQYMVENLHDLDELINTLTTFLSGKYQLPEWKIQVIEPTYKVIKKCLYPNGTSCEHLESYFDDHADAIKYAMKWSKRIAEIGRETVLYVILEA